jgi:hypothetical protein
LEQLRQDSAAISLLSHHRSNEVVYVDRDDAEMLPILLVYKPNQI